MSDLNPKFQAPPFQFGQTPGGDYVPPSSDAVWIRSFRDGVTQLRIAPASVTSPIDGRKLHGVDAWPTEVEHFDQVMQVSYVCPHTKGAAYCPGCSSNNEGTRRRSRYWYINALDNKGEMRIYKFGIKVHDALKGREDRLKAADPSNLQPLSDRDIIVTRTGRIGVGSGVNYDLDWGEKYDIEWDLDEFLDIPQAIGDAYLEAMEKYGIDVNADAPTPPEPEEETSAAPVGGRIQPRKRGSAEPVNNGKAPAKKAAAKRAPAKRAAPEPTSVEEIEEDEEPRLTFESTEEDLNNADTPELKRFLAEDLKLDFPAKAPRTRLIEMAKEAMKIPF